MNLIAFGSAVAVQVATLRWPLRRQLVTGMTVMGAGLAVLVASTWASPPSLALFLLGGALVGAGNGAIFHAGLGVVIATSGANDRAGALATFFVAGYAGVSVPVLGMGIALPVRQPAGRAAGVRHRRRRWTAGCCSGPAPGGDANGAG